MLGHISIMLRLVDRKCSALDGFPPKLKTLVEHMILSHHGKYEFGSPKLPSFPEALLLHYLDDMDSKLESMRASVGADQNDKDWTPYNRSLERALLKKERFLDGEEKVSASDGESEPGALAAKTPRPPRPQSLFWRAAPVGSEGRTEREVTFPLDWALERANAGYRPAPISHRELIFGSTLSA